MSLYENWIEGFFFRNDRSMTHFNEKNPLTLTIFQSVFNPFTVSVVNADQTSLFVLTLHNVQ